MATLAEQKKRRDYYEAKPHKALELLDLVESLEARIDVLQNELDYQLRSRWRA